MFNGQVTFSGSRPSSEVVDQAIRLAEHLRAQKMAVNTSQIIKGFDLADGTQVYVLDLAHVWTVHIIPPTHQDVPIPSVAFDEEIGLFDELPIISFVSGRASTGLGEVVDGELQVINPHATVALVSGGAARSRSAQLFTPAEAGRKIGVPERMDHRDITAMPDVIFTQLNSHQPGHFTGAMAPLVQLLLGVGKLQVSDYESRFLDREDLPPILDDSLYIAKPDGEILEEVPVEDVDTVAREPDGDDVEDGDTFAMMQIPFDYRWNRTHGVAWGDREALDFAPELAMRVDAGRTREPFIVELGQRGVSVMPMVRDEASFFEQVRDQYQLVYPELSQYTPFDGRTLFGGLGGFPLPVGIPGTTDELERWVKAGLVVRKPDALSEFYQGSALYTGHGWAFSQNGRRAINISRKWRNGLQYTECWQVGLTISQRPNIEFNPDADVVFQMVGGDFVDAYKAQRMSLEQMEAFIENPTREFFDELEVQPDWTLSVTATKIREGYISTRGMQCASAGVGGTPPFFMPGFGYSLTPGTPGSNIDPCDPRVGGVQFKVYEPMLGGVISVDFSTPRELWPYVPTANGPIFATFVDDAPEILHIYVERGPFDSAREDLNDRQPCQFVGQWTTGHRNVTARPNGNFYSTSRDFRRVDTVESASITRHQGRIVGMADYAENCHWFGTGIYVHKHVYAASQRETHSWGGFTRDVSVMCAANNRSAFFVCEQELKRGETKSRGARGRISVGRTGISHFGALYNFVFHWFGCGPSTGLSSTECWQKGLKISNGGCGAVLYPTTEPGGFDYCVSGGNYRWIPLVVSSPATNNAVIGSAYITPRPKVPAAWSETTQHPTDTIEYKIYGMGLPEMNGRLLREFEDSLQAGPGVDRLEFHYSGADTSWWRCSLEDCRTPPWRVARNYYGSPFVVTNEEIDFGLVEYGRQPSVGVGPSSILFGVVD